MTTSLSLDSSAADLLFRQARTANAFTDEPVTVAELQSIYDLVKFAPTAMNAQPLRLLFLRDEAAKARLLPHLAPGNRAKTSAAPVVAVLAYDLDFHLNLAETFPHAPGVAAGFSDLAARERFAEFNASLQAGYFLLGVRAAGLAAGPMSGYDADGVNAEFFAESTWRSLLVVNIGHAASEAAFERLPRLDFDRVASLD